MQMTASIRTVAVTQSDPFFTGRFFESFLPTARAKGVEVLEIALLPNFNESRAALLRRLASLYGPADLSRLVGRYARARVDERRGRPRGVEAVAAANGVAVRPLASINDPSYLATLRRRDVDVLLSVAAPQIFGSEALEATPLALNVHSGRLPEYRGMMPTFWALLHREDRVVVTVHEMADRVDAGEVLAEFDVPVAPEESAFEVARKAKAVAGREVAGLLAAVGTGSWPAPRPIDVACGRYHGFPSRKDARSLREVGRKML
jgi:methionyl-tRNA formyltransferase